MLDMRKGDKMSPFLFVGLKKCIQLPYKIGFTTLFEFSACAQGALHQADSLAKLWQEFLSLLELIA